MIDKTKLYLRFKSGVYAGLALSVNIKDEGGQEVLTYFDTNRGRFFEGKKVRESNAGFSFMTDTKELFEFQVATRKKYDEVARPTIEGNVPVFRYEQDLHEFYRRRFKP